MIKNLINKLLNKLTLHYYLKKYNGIWGFKNFLAQNNIQNIRLLEIFDAYFKRYGAWIGVKSQMAGLPCFPHEFYGIFISGGTIIGKNVVIFQHVTIGSNTLNDSKNTGCPTIGDNVYIGAGAKIIGKIVIGNNCRIGANAVVYQDMPANSVAVQAPTQIIQKSNLDNRFFGGMNGKLVYYDDGKWIEAK
ncbi:serine acetyltransferase [Candidatus Neomarinimicrobiota bacterium]